MGVDAGIEARSSYKKEARISSIDRRASIRVSTTTNVSSLKSFLGIRYNPFTKWASLPPAPIPTEGGGGRFTVAVRQSPYFLTIWKDPLPKKEVL